MRQNVWTMLGVFAAIFALAWFLNRGKTEAVGRQASIAAHTRAQPDPSQASAVTSSAPSLSAGEGPVPNPALQESPKAAEDSRGMDSEQNTSESPAIREPIHPPIVPAADSIRRNPPNGMIFAGTGRYQLYRQGDITWRLDTDSGQACILFATDEQWHLSRVFDHGCALSGRS